MLKYDSLPGDLVSHGQNKCCLLFVGARSTQLCLADDLSADSGKRPPSWRGSSPPGAAGAAAGEGVPSGGREDEPAGP